MKKEKFDGRDAAMCQGLDWVDLSESLNADDGQIAEPENDLEHSVVKGNTAGKTKSADNSKNSRSYRVNPEEEKAIRQSVDDKIIIRSKELREKRKSSSGKPAPKKSTNSRKPSDSNNKPAKAREEQVSYRSQKGLDKYRKMGVLPSKKNGPTQFRKDSQQWRDDDTLKAGVTDEAIDAAIENETFFEKIKSFSAVQWTAVGMAVVVFFTSVMTTGVYADYRGAVNMATAFSNLPRYEEGEAVAEGESGFTDLDSEFWTEDFSMPTAADGSESGNMLSLVLTSVEKDLKVKLVDENDTLVKDLEWGITITDEDGKESSYEDEDTDGIIHLTDITAGEYDVAITESPSLEGYVYPTVGQKVSVKAKIEYKVIANIKDEIKKESEVNAAAEDNGNKAADVETGKALVDTVEFVESSQQAEGDEFEEAEVCLSNTEIIASVSGRLAGALSTLAASLKGSLQSGLALAFNPVRVRQVADENDQKSPEEQYAEQLRENIQKQQEETQKQYEEYLNQQSQQGTNGENPVVTPSATPTPEVKQESKSVSNVSLDRASVTLNVGETCNLAFRLSPEGSCPETVEWKSQDNSVCSISEGKIRANAAGSTKVGVVINNDIYASCDVTVNAEEESKIVLTGSNTVLVGKEMTIEAKCTPESEKVITWYTSNNDVASVSAGDNKVVVRGNSEGYATITAQSVSGLTATFDITVKASEEYKDEAQLYDAYKNKLYVCENGVYRLAKYADYKNGSFDKFYRKATDMLYTGWQVIDGVTYYYTENHEKVTGDQVIGGVSYKFDSEGALAKGSGVLGIDVSKYQPSINWESVKASGVNFVIIRCGYRGASTGSLIQDPYFTSHIKGAKDVGLKVGIYFFSTALNEAEAVEEASMCAALCEGYGINYPVFLDVESSSRPGYNSLSVDQRTSNIKAFCSTISSAGYTPGLYANKTWLTEKINTSALSCKIWLAQYNAAGPTYTGHYDIWQYTSKGSVNGISGNVDMNKSYLSY